MKTIIMLSTAIFLFAMMIAPFNVTAQEIEEEIGPPSGDSITEACSNGWSAWQRPVRESWWSGSTTWVWQGGGQNFWASTSNDSGESAMRECVSSGHWCRFFNSCPNVIAVNMWNF